MTPSQKNEKALAGCPFCGGEAEYLNYGPEGQMIRCSDCCVIVDKDTKEQAIEAWNRRTTIAALSEPEPVAPVGGEVVTVEDVRMIIDKNVNGCLGDDDYGPEAIAPISAREVVALIQRQGGKQ